MRRALVFIGFLGCAPATKTEARMAPPAVAATATAPRSTPEPAQRASVEPTPPAAAAQPSPPNEPELSVPSEPERSHPDEPRALPPFQIEPPRAPGQAPLARPTGLVAASVADEELARWNLGGKSDSEYPSSRPGFHPAVRVVVDVRPLRRLTKESRNPAVLSERRLLAIARNLGYWPFRACFEASLRRRPQSAGGTSRVRIEIARSGRVAATRRIASELRDADAERCLERAARSLQFTPAPVRRLDVELTIKLSPGDVPLPTFETSAPPPDFDVAEIARLTQARAPSLAACCAAGLDRDAQLWGRAALRVSVAADGRVAQVREDGSHFPDPEVVRCFARTLGEQEPLTPARGSAFDYTLGLRCGAPPPNAPPEPDVPQASNAQAPE